MAENPNVVAGYEFEILDETATREVARRTRPSSWAPLAEAFIEKVDPHRSLRLTVKDSKEASKVTMGIKNALSSMGYVNTRNFISTSTQENNDGTLSLVIAKLQPLVMEADLVPSNGANDASDDD